LNGGEIMNDVFAITQKSINFFVNFFNTNKRNQNNVQRFIEQEFKPIDRNWAYEKYKNIKD